MQALFRRRRAYELCPRGSKSKLIKHNIIILLDRGWAKVSKFELVLVPTAEGEKDNAGKDDDDDKEERETLVDAGRIPISLEEIQVRGDELETKDEIDDKGSDEEDKEEDKGALLTCLDNPGGGPREMRANSGERVKGGSGGEGGDNIDKVEDSDADDDCDDEGDCEAVSKDAKEESDLMEEAEENEEMDVDRKELWEYLLFVEEAREP